MRAQTLLIISLLGILSTSSFANFWTTQKESLNRLIEKFDHYSDNILNLRPEKTGEDTLEPRDPASFQTLQKVYEGDETFEATQFDKAQPLEHYKDWNIQVNVRDASVKDLLTFMFAAVGQNILFDSATQERVELNQTKGKWLHTVQNILDAFDLRVDWVQNADSTGYYRIYDISSENRRMAALITQYEERAKLLKNARKIAQLEEYYRRPSQVHLFQLKYASVKDILGPIATTLGKKYGEIAPDLSAEGPNKLLFLGSPEQLELTKSVIQKLDKKKKQVFLEIFIVGIGDKFNKALASRITRSKDTASTTNNDTSFDIQALPKLASDFFKGTFSVLNFLGSQRLSLELNALEDEGLSQTLFNPKVILIDGTESKIVQGVQFLAESERKTDSNNNTTVTKKFKDANLNIGVKANILQGDESVRLELVLNNDTPDLNSDPVTINKFQIQNTLIVPDGGVVAIGGVLRQSMEDQISGVPILKDIPLIGGLFSGREQDDKLDEIMIFIAPSIID